MSEMTTDRGPDISETAIFQSWLDRGLLHPPMVTLGWPGGAARVMPVLVYAAEISRHLFMEHASWAGSLTDAVRLAESHDEEHWHMLWSHFGFSGFVHVHELDSGAADCSPQEWEW